MVIEPDTSKSDAAFAKLSAQEQAQITNFKEIDAQAKKANETLQNESAKSSKALEQNEKSVSTLVGSVKNLGQQIPGAFQVQQVLGFAKETANASKAVTGLSGTFNILKIAIAGTGIGLLIVALISLYTYFTKSEEGGDKLARIMGAIKEITGDLTKLLISFGKYASEAIETVFNWYVKVYSFLIDKFIGAIRTVSETLDAIGLDSAAEKVNSFANKIQAAKDAVSDWADGLGEAGIAIANLEDKIEALTTTVSISNNKLQTEVEQNLKGLRNRTLSYQEQLVLIGKVGDAEREKLKNSNILLDLQMQRERALFIMQAQNAEEGARLFDDFAAGRIKADELSDRVDGENTQETIDNIAKVINAREDALRESLLVETRLDNLRDQYAQAEKAREDARIKKKFDDLKAEEGFAIRRAQVEGATQTEITAIQIRYDELRLGLYNKYNLTATNDYQDSLVKREELDKQYTLAYIKEQEARIQKSADKANLANESNSTIELNALKELYLNKQITFEQFQAQTAQIAKDAQLSAIQTDIEANQEKLRIAQENGIDTLAIEKSIEDGKRKLYDLEVADFKDKEDKKTKAQKEAEAIRKAENEKALQLGTTISNGLFQLGKSNNAAALADSQARQDAELKAAGDNKVEQDRINKKFAKEQANLKTKQAIADKAESLFQIGLATVVAVAKQAAATPLPAGAALIALVGAIGAAQFALAAAKPIPKFNKGTKSVPGYDTGDDSVLAMLRPGEGVMPVDRMKEYAPAFNAIFDRKVPAGFLNSIVMDYDNLGRQIMAVPADNSLVHEIKAMSRKLDKLKVLEINMDKKGFSAYMKSENSSSEIANNYLNV